MNAPGAAADVLSELVSQLFDVYSEPTATWSTVSSARFPGNG